MLTNWRTQSSRLENQKTDKTYRFCKKICTQKAVCVIFSRPAAHKVLKWPIEEAENIDGQRPGDNRNKRIQGRCDVIVEMVLHQHSGTAVNNLIPEESQNKRQTNMCRNQGKKGEFFLYHV